jgi:ribose 5-phosphate isomerase A
MPPSISFSQRDREDDRARLKQLAAEYAVRFVQSGMRVGLGTGSTAYFATRRIAQLIHDGILKEVIGFPTSKASWLQAESSGIVLMDDSMPDNLDVTIDGADEVDPNLNLIKGGGGALFREKIVAQASRREIIAVDDSKLSSALGMHHSLPIEVAPFGWQSQMKFLESLDGRPKIRTLEDGTQFVTDSGNMIFDCSFDPITDPAAVAATLSARAGIIEHGLFIGLATDLIVASDAGIRHLQRRGATIGEVSVD